MNLFSQLDVGGGEGQIDIPQVSASDIDPARIVSAVLVIASFLAIIFIVISGIRYTLSAGDPQQTSKAKDGIIYSVAGLAICLFSYAIIRFVFMETGLSP